MKKFNVYFAAIVGLILVGSMFSISARRQAAPYVIYDEDRNFDEMLPVGESVHVAALQFDRVWNEEFFPRAGDVFQHATPIFVNVSGICTAKSTLTWQGLIGTDLYPPVEVFNTVGKAAVFNRSFYGSEIDFTIKQYGTVPVGVGCHVTMQEIK